MVFLCSRLIALALLIPKVTLESKIGPPSPKLRPSENVDFTEHRMFSKLYLTEHKISQVKNVLSKNCVILAECLFSFLRLLSPDQLQKTFSNKHSPCQPPTTPVIKECQTFSDIFAPLPTLLIIYSRLHIYMK